MGGRATCFTGDGDEREVKQDCQEHLPLPTQWLLQLSPAEAPLALTSMVIWKSNCHTNPVKKAHLSAQVRASAFISTRASARCLLYRMPPAAAVRRSGILIHIGFLSQPTPLGSPLCYGTRGIFLTSCLPDCRSWWDIAPSCPARLGPREICNPVCVCVSFLMYRAGSCLSVWMHGEQRE